MREAFKSLLTHQIAGGEAMRTISVMLKYLPLSEGTAHELKDIETAYKEVESLYKKEEISYSIATTLYSALDNRVLSIINYSIELK